MGWKNDLILELHVATAIRLETLHDGLDQPEPDASEALPVTSKYNNTWSAAKPLCNYFAFISSCPMPCGQRGEPKNSTRRAPSIQCLIMDKHTLARRGHPTQRVLVRITRLQIQEGKLPRSEVSPYKGHRTCARVDKCRETRPILAIFEIAFTNAIPLQGVRLWEN